MNDIRRLTRRELARSFAQLIPNMIRGAQLDFFAKRSITQTQFLVLMSVHSYTRCAMGTLARNLHVRMPTVTGVVERLVGAGHLRRSPHPEDRRRVMVELTAKGREFVRAFQSMLQGRWNEALSVLSPREIQNMYQAIEKIQRQLKSETRS
jgi:DNA-binding MarR family transcriptional regulator